MGRAFRAEWTRMRKGFVAALLLGTVAAFGIFSFLFFRDGSRGGEMYWDGLGEGEIPMAAGIFFSGIYVRLLFERRGMSQDMMWGRSRLAVFLVRLAEVYLLSFLLCVPLSLANLRVLSTRWTMRWTMSQSSLGWLRMLYCVLMSMLLNLRYIGVGIMLGFALRDLFRLLGVLLGGTAAYLLLFPLVSIIWGPESPAVQTLKWARDLVFGGLFDCEKLRDVIMLFRASGMKLLRTALGTAAFMLVHGGLAYLFFRKAELE